MDSRHAGSPFPATSPASGPAVEVRAQSIELVRQWWASTLFATHFGAHEDPNVHLDAMQTHRTTMTDIAREYITADGGAADQQRRFVDEMRGYIE